MTGDRRGSSKPNRHLQTEKMSQRKKDSEQQTERQSQESLGDLRAATYEEAFAGREMGERARLGVCTKQRCKRKRMEAKQGWKNGKMLCSRQYIDVLVFKNCKHVLNGLIIVYGYKISSECSRKHSFRCTVNLVSDQQKKSSSRFHTV